MKEANLLKNVLLHNSGSTIMQLNTNSKDNLILQSIREGSTSELSEIYVKNQQNFISYAGRHFSVSSDFAKDCYTDTILKFREMVLDHRITEIHSSIEAYIFASAKNQLIKALNLEAHFIRNSDFDRMVDDNELPEFDLPDMDDFFQLLENILKEIPIICYKIIKMSYFLNLSSKEIAEMLDMKDELFVNSRKYRCFLQIKIRFEKAKQQNFKN